mmetsp:Transcript_22312/g.55508  ORF Transcript_22312/g.55508 Transcript_22312/m.55508 type:complete len:402 (-) Transcript_22312:109-1314(-)
MDAMRKLNASSRLPHLCVEAHTGIDEKITWVERLRELDELRSSFALSGVPMRMVLLLRLREPLDHYLSFFVWAVAERQARSPAKFGSSFEEWVRRVPNLQSELVLSSKAASTAGFAPRTHPEVRAWVKRWGSLKAYSERRARVWQSVKLYNVVGTTELFDETNLLVARALSWDPSDAASPIHQHKIPQAGASCNLMLRMERRQRGERSPWWCRDPTLDRGSEQRRVHHAVCPNRSACEQLIRDVAPVDYELYEHARQSVQKRIASAGRVFGQQMRELLSAKRNFMAPRCIWRPLHPFVIASARRQAAGSTWLRKFVPDFGRNGTCVQGDQAVMQVIWIEHGRGGRTKPGFPLSNLIRISHRRARMHMPSSPDEIDARTVPQSFRRNNIFRWLHDANVGRGV